MDYGSDGRARSPPPRPRSGRRRAHRTRRLNYPQAGCHTGSVPPPCTSRAASPRSSWQARSPLPVAGARCPGHGPLAVGGARLSSHSLAPALPLELQVTAPATWPVVSRCRARQVRSAAAPAASRPTAAASRSSRTHVTLLMLPALTALPPAPRPRAPAPTRWHEATPALEQRGRRVRPSRDKTNTGQTTAAQGSGPSGSAFAHHLPAPSQAALGPCSSSHGSCSGSHKLTEHGGSSQHIACCSTHLRRLAPHALHPGGVGPMQLLLKNEAQRPAGAVEVAQL